MKHIRLSKFIITLVAFAANTSACRADEPLQSLSPKMDESPSPASTPSPTPKLHKLEVNQSAIGASEQASTPLQAMLGQQTDANSFELKGYAQRDTGYGVCGILLVKPLMVRGYATILKSYPTMPAAEADIQRGDLVVTINGQSTRDIPPREIWDYVTGVPGTEVNFLLSRNGNLFQRTIKRMDIGRIPDNKLRSKFLALWEHNGMSKFLNTPTATTNEQ